MTIAQRNEYERLFANNFNASMKGVRIGATSVTEFKKTYPSLFNVIIQSMHEASKLK